MRRATSPREPSSFDKSSINFRQSFSSNRPAERYTKGKGIAHLLPRPSSMGILQSMRECKMDFCNAHNQREVLLERHTVLLSRPAHCSANLLLHLYQKRG